MQDILRQLEEKRAAAKLGGGEEKIARQHAADKLTARERIALLIDEGTFTELGIHAQPHYSVEALRGKDAPADGVITGFGKVDGRLVCVCAYDFTVMAGSMGVTGETKVTRLREMALQKRIPFIWLLDSAGGRIQEAVGSYFAGSGYLFKEEVIMSGVVPQIAAVMGPCAAGTAYIPGLADFVPMVSGRGSMALAGPHLVRAATGEEVTQEELGGARIHCRKSGVGDIECDSDEECIQKIKQYLGFFPQNSAQKPPVIATNDPIDRREDELLDVLPHLVLGQLLQRREVDLLDQLAMQPDLGVEQLVRSGNRHDQPSVRRESRIAEQRAPGGGRRDGQRHGRGGCSRSGQEDAAPWAFAAERHQCRAVCAGVCRGRAASHHAP